MNKRKLIIFGGIAVAVILAVAIVFALVSSNSNQHSSDGKIDDSDIPSYSSGFVCSADITYASLSTKVNITKNAVGLYNIEVVEPDVLSGMSFGFEHDNITVKYLGMTIDLPEELIPTTSAASVIVEIFDILSSKDELSAYAKENTLDVKGKGSLGEFSVEVNPDDLTILKIELPTADFSATIYDFELK